MAFHSPLSSINIWTHSSTGSSEAVSHPKTVLAQYSLTSVFKWELVLPTQHGHWLIIKLQCYAFLSGNELMDMSQLSLQRSDSHLSHYKNSQLSIRYTPVKKPPCLMWPRQASNRESSYPRQSRWPFKPILSFLFFFSTKWSPRRESRPWKRSSPSSRCTLETFDLICDLLPQSRHNCCNCDEHFLFNPLRSSLSRRLP